MKRYLLTFAFVALASPVGAQGLKIPNTVYAAAAAADITTSLRCTPPRCHESNPAIAWMQPYGHVKMHVIAASADAAGVWAWNKWVGKKHPRLAAVGLYAVAATRVGIAVRNVNERRQADAEWGAAGR